MFEDQMQGELDVVHIDLDGDIVPALVLAPGMAILRGFPRGARGVFGDLVTFDPEQTTDALSDEGKLLVCHPFLAVQQPGGYRQFRCPVLSRDLEDLVPVAAELWRQRIAMQAIEETPTVQWLDLAVPTQVCLADAAHLLMDLCSLVGAEAWPYELLTQDGGLDEVVGLLEDMPLQKAQGAFLHFIVARSLEETERYDKAIQHYRMACRHDPSSPALRENLALCLANAGHTVEAEIIFRQAVAQFPKDAMLRRNFEQFLENLGRNCKMHFDMI